MPEETPLSPPTHFSIDAEEAVIGSLLIDDEAWDEISGHLTKGDFYSRDCAAIYEAIRDLADRSEPIDLITVGDHLKNGASPDEADGGSDAVLARLARLAQETPSAANVGHYARIVREHAVRRRLLVAAHRIAKDVSENKERMGSTELLDKAEQTIFQLGDEVAKINDITSMRQLAPEVLKKTKDLSQSGDAVTGLATGYTEFDTKTGGIQNGDFLILAGRPSMGKTALALCLAEHAALKSDRGSVVMFSMEMSMQQIAQRLCSSIGRVDQLRLRTGKLQSTEWAQLTQAVHVLNSGENEILIDDTPALRPENIRAKVRRLIRRHKKIGLVIIDYLQLMRPGRPVENRNLEITEISQSLKALAREADVPILALSQLNRNLEQRHNKRPQMSDLRDSGSLEQDADVIIFIYRDEVYNENSEDKGTAEIIVGKQRNGPQFMSKLTFRSSFTRFENHADASFASEYKGMDSAPLPDDPHDDPEGP